MNFMTIFRTAMKDAFRISTNMPGIGSLICEIGIKISEISESKHNFAQ